MFSVFALTIVVHLGRLCSYILSPLGVSHYLLLITLLLALLYYFITYYFIAFITIVGFFRFSADRKISKSLFIISDDLYIL